MKTPSFTASPRTQHGLVLVMALILMAIIGISSSAAIRLALTSNAVAIGLKASNEAQQRAEIALRWCEVQARLRYLNKGAPDSANFFMVPKDTLAKTQAMSRDFNQFLQNSRPVPANILTAAGLPVGNQLPQCLCQEAPVAAQVCAVNDYTCATNSNPLYGSYVLTVRATSTDFREATGGTDAGSEVWLQSALLLAIHP